MKQSKRGDRKIIVNKGRLNDIDVCLGLAFSNKYVKSLK